MAANSSEPSPQHLPSEDGLLRPTAATPLAASAPPAPLPPPTGSATMVLASPPIEVLAADVDRLEPRVRTFVERFAATDMTGEAAEDGDVPPAGEAPRRAVVDAVQRLATAALDRTLIVPTRQVVEMCLWALQVEAAAGRRDAALTLVEQVAALMDVSDAAGEPITILDSTQDELEALLGVPTAASATAAAAADRNATVEPTVAEGGAMSDAEVTIVDTPRPAELKASPDTRRTDLATTKTSSTPNVAAPSRRGSNASASTPDGRSSSESRPSAATSHRNGGGRPWPRKAFDGKPPISFPRSEPLGYTLEVHPDRRMVIELRMMALPIASPGAAPTRRVGLFIDIENIIELDTQYEDMQSMIRRIHWFASGLGTLACSVAAMSAWTMGDSWADANEIIRAENFEIVAPPSEMGGSSNEETRRNASDFALLAAMERRVRELQLDTIVVCSGDAAFYQFVKTHITERGNAVVVSRNAKRSALFDRLTRFSKSAINIAGRCDVQTLAGLPTEPPALSERANDGDANGRAA